MPWSIHHWSPGFWPYHLASTQPGHQIRRNGYPDSHFETSYAAEGLEVLIRRLLSCGSQRIMFNINLRVAHSEFGIGIQFFEYIHNSTPEWIAHIGQPLH